MRTAQAPRPPRRSPRHRHPPRRRPPPGRLRSRPNRPQGPGAASRRPRYAGRMRIGAGASTIGDSVAAAATATREARGSLGEATPDLALVFASPHHADQAEALLAAVHEEAAPAGLIGCVGESVVGGPVEIEAEPAVAVWLGS